VVTGKYSNQTHNKADKIASLQGQADNAVIHRMVTHAKAGPVRVTEAIQQH
jgi:hypothetical protein